MPIRNERRNKQRPHPPRRRRSSAREQVDIAGRRAVLRELSRRFANLIVQWRIRSLRRVSQSDPIDFASRHWIELSGDSFFV